MSGRRGRIQHEKKEWKMSADAAAVFDNAPPLHMAAVAFTAYGVHGFADAHRRYVGARSAHYVAITAATRRGGWEISWASGGSLMVTGVKFIGRWSAPS
jgi:hypothetical protein